MTASVPPVRQPSLTSHRDRDVLRSFAQRIDPSDAGAHNNLGVLYYNKGLYEEAVGAFMRALELDQKMQVAQRNLEIAYFNTGYYDKRIPELRERLRQHPENHDALYLMGFVLGDMGRHEEARDVTKRAIKLNPTLSRAQANLSLEQGRPQRYEEAVAAREERRGREMQVATEGRLARYNLGLAFRQKGYFVEALREYRLALEQGEDKDLVLQAMAEVHLLRKDPKAALELYEQLLTSQSSSPKL